MAIAAYAIACGYSIAVAARAAGVDAEALFHHRRKDSFVALVDSYFRLITDDLRLLAVQRMRRVLRHGSEAEAIRLASRILEAHGIWEPQGMLPEGTRAALLLQVPEKARLALPAESDPPII